MDNRYYVVRLYDFLERLSRNNNREWFAANKSEYDDLRARWMDDLDRMLAYMTQWDPALATQTAKTSAFRIYRDIRFSRDKSPYKPYFSAAISPWGRKTDRAGYYLHMGLPAMYDSGLYGGIYSPDRDMLLRLRKTIVDNIEEFEEIINAPDMVRLFPGWVGERLKTVPKGWSKDHPHAELLKLKDYGKWHPCDESWFADSSWPERSAEMFAVLKPLVDFLNNPDDEPSIVI